MEGRRAFHVGAVSARTVSKASVLKAPAIACLALAMATAGCTTFGTSRPAAPEPLQPVPTAPVATTQLPPPEPTPEAQQPAQPAALPSADAALSVQRSDMIGGWTVESGGARCQLFMVLTGWSGGYRASTRGCSSDVLKTISAWDLNGKEITLKDSSAAPVATLYSTAANRFEGRLASGQAISVSR
ncbi:protease inhibitor Inh/omp19 family protein [Segnochrobactrum spirostomi]|uniref:Alkaline proteinase inhibitor/ Outer membrane lipoprotein Omp19 domain-containing protein n=1 Tax=Segnochrobactrum spirostomi TaxID=2608987 RepID=A0A6A7Y3X8_9HYPH|nr:protease inhibitor Inh/omp19 family protein [Segnochrobactrum spirostomi]MQT12948.1 hypothetical protein [Segnochrobactrum spirostomi]